MKRSFVVTLSAAGASGLVDLGGDRDDDGRRFVPMAGGTAQQPNVPPISMNPPFVNPMPNPPFVTPTPQPLGGQGGAPGIAGVGGSYNPPSPCPQVPVNGTSCSFEITCEFPQTTPCVPGKRAVCSGNRWTVTDDWRQWSCDRPPPGEDAGTAFD